MTALTQDTINSLRRNIKIAQQRCRRKDARIVALQQQMLQNVDAGKFADALFDHFSGFALEIVAHLYKNAKLQPQQRTYSEAIRGFAEALYQCSPIAYKFVQAHFHLPSKHTIKKWVSESALEKVQDEPVVPECQSEFEGWQIEKW